MDTVYLHWNVTNWITVVLMAALGFMLVSTVAQYWHSNNSNAGL